MLFLFRWYRILFLGCSLLYSFFLFPGSSPNQLSSNGFVENKGQILNQANFPNKDVLFMYTGKGIKIQLLKTGYSYELFSAAGLKSNEVTHQKSEFTARKRDLKIHNYRVDIQFLNANKDPLVVTEQKSDDYINYYNVADEITYIHSYRKIIYRNIYDKTDIEFLIEDGAEHAFKYNIILHPGANINDVKFMINGASEIKNSGATIEISTPLGTISEKIPFSYYVNHPAVNQPVNFKLKNNIISFSGIFDNTQTLVIDPSTNLIWCSYYGGSVLEYCTCNGVDSQDNVYIAGHTFSSNNIATNGAYQSVINASLDGFIAKFNSSGFRLWASYFGGSGAEQIFSMCLDANGNVYLSGDTFSTANIASVGAHQTVYGGGIDDALLVKFSGTGIRFWSTYFGGAEHDISQAVTVDQNSNVIIAGHSESNNLATQGAYKSTYSFAYDVFIAKFSSTGTLQWCTYYGDSGVDEAYSIVTDAGNSIYITGLTSSIAGISTPASHQVNSGGLTDCFIAKFNALGNILQWATYYGGIGDDHGTVIRVKKNGNVFIAGTTTSSNNIATPNAHQTVRGSADDAFVTSFSVAGARLWASYFGGDDTDYINDLVIDGNSNIIFCGQTLSTVSVSTLGAYQPNLSSIFNYDAFVAKFSNSGQKKLATYFGGPGNENGRGIAVNSTGKIYLAGETTSTVNVSTLGSHQPIAGGSQDGFLAKFCSDIEPVITPNNGTLCIGVNTITASNGYSNYLWNNGSTTNPMVTNNTTVQGTYQYAVFVDDGFGCSGKSDTAVITIANCYVSIKEFAGNEKAILYPIPSHDFINVVLPDEFTVKSSSVKIYSSKGDLVLNAVMRDQRLEIDIRELPIGLYFLQVTGSNGVTRKKFVKD
jgi:hypothetical protein